MDKALVLSSGGVDSTTCIGIAVKEFGKENVSTVSIYYGQKHNKELKCAERIAEYYDVKHYVLDISTIMRYSNCSLLSHSTEEITQGKYSDQIAQSETGRVSTYVPFRNGLMLSSVAALAVSIYPEDIVHIYIGAHADDAAGNAYADCSKDFTDAMHQAIKIGTYEKVLVEAPLVNMNKAQVVSTGLSLKVPYNITYSCYEGRDKSCGKCGTCIDRREAFIQNGTEDPIEYEE
jgi:7-cyano-7-deazaguanine synthase